MGMALQHEQRRARRSTPRARPSARRAAAVLASCALGATGLPALTGCQGPGGYSVTYFGTGEACSKRAYEDAGPVCLEGTLEPLQSTFDADAERPRIIALLPHLGCERGAEILREQVLDA